MTKSRSTRMIVEKSDPWGSTAAPARWRFNIGQVQSRDDIVHRLELGSLETKATLDQVNSIQKFWDASDIEPLRETIS